MAMKPRTFRRVVLLGSLAALVLIGALGYFVVRPMITQHKLGAMRTDGLAAAEAGDYPEATKLLGRYLSSGQDYEPELLLAFARARLKVTSPDGGHIRAAVKAYRDYLIRVPDDVEASQELLPLFNMMGLYVEAKSLAQDLRTKLGDTRIESIRQELLARKGLGENNDTFGPLLKEAAEHKDASFGDLITYADWLRAHGQGGEAITFINGRLALEPDAIGTRLASVWYSILDSDQVGTAEGEEQLLNDLVAALGLDPKSGDWIDGPVPYGAGVAEFADRFLNRLQRQDLSLKIRLAAAELSDDITSAVWAARRLYWSRQDDRLDALDLKTEDGEPIADVVGYQILAAMRHDDAAHLAALKEKLTAIRLDFRARAWQALFDGVELMDEGKSVEARPKIRHALELYPSEPSFHMAMGNLQWSHGRLDDARDEWIKANQLANGNDYGRGQVGPLGWVEPMVRLIDAYSRSNRLPETVEYLQELTRVAPKSPLTNTIVLKSFAALARNNNLSRDAVRAVLDQYELQEKEYTPEYRALIAPQIATLYASQGSKDQTDRAASMIRDALILLKDSPQWSALLPDLLDVDQHYHLGVAQKAGLDIEQVATQSPTAALRYAMGVFEKTGEVDKGLAVIEDGQGDDPYAWELVRAKYLDATGDERAMKAWENLRAQNPDNISLLYEIAESKAYMIHVDKVNEVINTIIEKTSTAGDTLPARLRLAQAAAIVAKEQTSESKQKALEIVRAVVAIDPGNIKARNMLGRLLEMQPNPDYAGAIRQYMTIARQIEGRGAQVYLLQAVDLSFKSNDLDSARQYLLEFNTRYPDDYENLPLVARRLVNIGMPDQAIDIYQRIYRNSGDRETGVDAGLALVDLYYTQDRPAQGRAMLSDLSTIDALSSDQLAELAGQFTRHGEKDEGDRLAHDGQRYGLDEYESAVAYAKYAQRFVSAEEYVRVLGELVEAHPDQTEGWKMLITHLVRTNQYEQAQERLAQARKHIEFGDEFNTLEALAQGEPTSVSDLLGQLGDDSNPIKARAATLVDNYNKGAPNQTSQQRIAILTAMLDELPDFSPLQTFALSQLSELPIDPAILAQLADRAVRSDPTNIAALRVGANAYLRASMPIDAIRLARIWRANALGSTVESDLVTAQAMAQTGDFTQSVQALEPYITGAIQNPDTPISQEVLYAYSFAKLRSGEKPAATAARLEPLLAEHASIRTRVWLTLAVVAVPDAKDGAQWISTVTEYAQPDEMAQIASAWVSLADRHQAWEPEYAQAAIAILEPSPAAQEPGDPAVLGTLAQAYTILARGTQEPDQKKQAYGTAVTYMMRASKADPSNLAYLLQGASLATEGGDYTQAEALYRDLLAKDIANPQLVASFKNNLALVIETLYTDDSRLNEAMELAQQATDTVDAPTFWGTRGWIELALKQAPKAEESFRHAIGLDDTDAEGWVGLAISLGQQGPDRAQDAQQAFDRVLRLDQDGKLSDELRNRIRKQGLAPWPAQLTS